MDLQVLIENSVASGAAQPLSTWKNWLKIGLFSQLPQNDSSRLQPICFMALWSPALGRTDNLPTDGPSKLG